MPPTPKGGPEGSRCSGVENNVGFGELPPTSCSPRRGENRAHSPISGRFPPPPKPTPRVPWGEGKAALPLPAGQSEAAGSQTVIAVFRTRNSPVFELLPWCGGAGGAGGAALRLGLV